jgi:hypothetical protein
MSSENMGKKNLKKRSKILNKEIPLITCTNNKTLTLLEQMFLAVALMLQTIMEIKIRD